MNASSAASSSVSPNWPSSTRVAGLAGELEHRRARDAGEDAEVERRRQQRPVAAPPDVRRRPLEHRPLGVHEDGVVGALPLRLRLGGDVDRVARRLDARQEPRLVGANAAQRDQPLAALAQRAVVVAELADERERDGRRRPVEPQDGIGRGGCVERLLRQLLELEPVHVGQADPLGRAGEAREVLRELERPAAVDADRLEGGAAAQQRLVVGSEHRLGRIDDTAARDGDCEQGHRRCDLDRRADGGEQRPRLRPRLLDLGLGLRVPDDAAADPEVDPALGDGERADRQREVEVAVAADDAERSHRGATADRLERGDQVERGDLRRAGDRAAREGRVRAARRGRRRRGACPRPSRRGA